MVHWMNKNEHRCNNNNNNNDKEEANISWGKIKCFIEIDIKHKRDIINTFHLWPFMRREAQINKRIFGLFLRARYCGIRVSALITYHCVLSYFIYFSLALSFCSLAYVHSMRLNRNYFQLWELIENRYHVNVKPITYNDFGCYDPWSQFSLKLHIEFTRTQCKKDIVKCRRLSLNKLRTICVVPESSKLLFPLTLIQFVFRSNGLFRGIEWLWRSSSRYLLVKNSHSYCSADRTAYLKTHFQHEHFSGSFHGLFTCYVRHSKHII